MRPPSFTVLLALAVPSLGSDPFTYDHQTTTYDASFSPVQANSSESVKLAPFFSPEHSSDTLVGLIEEATESIDIYTPSAGSWVSACGGYVDDDSATCAPGCSPAEMQTETFPIFPALINALHRGVAVRIVTNDYGTPDCEGTITMLQYLALNGASVNYFTTTTYVHAKFTSIDGGRKFAVSSINWSKASMIKNREAGAVIEGSDSLAEYVTKVFDYDFSISYPLVPGTWSDADLATIQSSDDLPVVLPVVTPTEGLYVTPAPVLTSWHAGDTLIAQTSPDSAFETLTAQINNTKESLEIAMYQVTSDELCDSIIDLHNSGVNVSLLVSSRIYDYSDCKAAQACYADLYAAGLRFRKTSFYYTYSHNKYWISDGVLAGWSTGNWSPTDYPNHGEEYPPYGDADWAKANRDFTVYTSTPEIVAQFQDTMWGDWYAPEAYDWEPQYDIYCGS